MTAAEVQIIINSAIENTSQKLKLGQSEYLKKYFRIYAASLSSDDIQEHGPILALNRLLDVLELQVKFPPIEEPDLVARLEAKIKNVYADGDRNTGRLPSLIELAALELETDFGPAYKENIVDPTNNSIRIFEDLLKAEGDDVGAVMRARRKAKKADPSNEDKAVKNLKQAIGENFKFRHKYVCFVIADGDNMGSLLSAIGADPEKTKEFSQGLERFAQLAVDQIDNYGGIPVYAGGDDLLFIAPIQNGKKENIFTLVKALNKLFKGCELDKISPSVSQEDKPTLSFGISISYYKYPMSESLEAMGEQLRDVAKQCPGKNAVAFRVLKHSGQPFQSLFKHDGVVAHEFETLLASCAELDQSFLSSVMHRLVTLKSYLEDALTHQQTEHFFKNHFNESVHLESAFIDAVHKLTKASWIENKEDINNSINQVFATLRFIQFLNQEDHD